MLLQTGLPLFFRSECSASRREVKRSFAGMKYFFVQEGLLPSGGFQCKVFEAELQTELRVIDRIAICTTEFLGNMSTCCSRSKITERILDLAMSGARPTLPRLQH